MEVAILGPVEVNGVAVGGREAAVLAALAVRTPQSASVDELIDAVWGDDPPMTAPKSLQNAISRLRRDTEADIETVERGYRLRTGVDLHRAEALHRAGDPEAALAVWRGDPAAVPSIDRARLAELRASLEEEAAAALVGRGDYAEAVAALEAAVGREPYRERRWALLTRALAASGRQADALRAVQRARTILGDELGLDPGAELVEAERAVFELASPAHSRRAAPVPTTSFIGRDDDIGRVRARLALDPVVTITGPGGVGKTRLALAASSGDEVVFVDLAPVGGGDGVWDAVASAGGIAVGSDVTGAVVDALQSGIVLLDNCEHVLDAAADVASSLRTTVLATSREPLGLPGETVITLSPLAVDDGVRLFMDRATSAGAANEDPLAAAELCRRLDGLPLAIELAAARAPALDATQVLDRLDDRFALLDERARRGDPRHRALSAVVDWSYDLLDEEEQSLFERLSVFQAPFTLDDAEALATDERVPSVAPVLTGLVRASMVAVETRDGERRYRLLETFRDYAAARLQDADHWRGRHLEWMEGLAREAGPELAGPAQLRWFARIGAAFEDLQAALAWCEQRGPASAGLAIATNLFHFWLGRARRYEGLRWLEHFAKVADEVPSVDRCRGLFGAGMIAMMADLSLCDRLGEVAQRIADDRDSHAVADALTAIGPIFRGDVATAAPLLDRSRAVLEEAQHTATMPQIWDARAFVAMLDGRFEDSRRFLRGTTDRLEAMGERHVLGAMQGFEADVAFAMGDSEARAIAGNALALAREAGCPSCLSSALGATALTGDVDAAGDRNTVLRHSVRLVADLGEMSGVVYGAYLLAGALAETEPDLAARLLGGVSTLRERTGHLVNLPGRDAFATPRLDAARLRMGEDAWDAAVMEGRTLSFEALVDLAG